MVIAEQELNQYWKTVVDTIQEGVMIVDPEGVIVSANRAFLELTGYDLDELVGQPCSRLNCTACHLERNRELYHWCRLFRDGAIRKQRCVLTRRDGSRLHILKNACVLQDTHGTVIGAVETVTDISELLERETRIEAFRRELSARDTFHGMVGISAAMQRVFTLITNAAESDAPVIIQGESGTGKELAARAIHDLSSRRNGPYIKVNCAALNESLLESELFGHVKGAFTGAIHDREGRFEAAQGGSIFLDEIGDMPESTQVKLLRVLEEKVIERVGDNRPIPIDVRIITATNRNLKEMVHNKRFRKDFYYRINVIPIHIPPIRERREDIPPLAESFFNKLRLKTNREIQGIGKEAMEMLIRYDWPGNVRELRSTFEYAFVICQGNTITADDLPPALQCSDSLTSRQSFSRSNAVDLPPTLQCSDTPRRRPSQAPDPPVPAAGEEEGSCSRKEELLEALDRARGNQTRAAKLLGVSRVTVWKRMKQYGIDAKKVRERWRG